MKKMIIAVSLAVLFSLPDDVLASKPDDIAYGKDLVYILRVISPAQLKEDEECVETYYLTACALREGIQKKFVTFKEIGTTEREYNGWMIILSNIEKIMEEQDKKEEDERKKKKGEKEDEAGEASPWMPC